MNYLAEFRQEARSLYVTKGIEAVIQFSANKILESYKNGLDKNNKSEPKEPRFRKSIS